MLHGYYEDVFANNPRGLYAYDIKNEKPLNVLYDELLSILDEKTFRPEVWEKMLNEKDKRRKAAIIERLWDSFDTSSDDPNIDHKYNRDYLWNKMFEAQPNDLPHYEHPDPTDVYDDFNGWNPTGISNPADYMSNITFEKDTDDDGDMDTKVTVGKAKQV